MRWLRRCCNAWRILRAGLQGGSSCREGERGRRPGRTRGFLPVQHGVEVEGLAAGELGDDDVEEERGQREKEGELDGVDRALDGVHLPLDVGREGRGHGAEDAIERIHEAGFRERWIDEVRPAALHEDEGRRGDGAGEERRPRACRRAKAGVESEDHDRPRAACPDGHGEGREHLDVVELLHVVGAEQEERADADGDEPDHADVAARCEGLLAQRHHNILRDRERGAVDARVVRGEHREEEQKRECAEKAGRKEPPHGGRERLLVEKSANLLEAVVGEALGVDVGAIDAGKGRGLRPRAPASGGGTCRLPSTLRWRYGNARLPSCREGERGRRLRRTRGCPRLREQRFVDGGEKGGVGVGCLRERRIDADFMADRGDLRNGTLYGGEGLRVVAQDVGRDARGEVAANGGRLFGEVGVVKECDERAGDDEVEHRHYRAAPGAEDAGHLLLVRALGRRGVAVAEPACAVHDHPVGRYRDHREEVEVSQLADVERVDEAFARHPVGHHGHDFARDGELPQDEYDEAHEQREEDGRLHGVGDDERQRSAAADERDGERQEEEHQRDVGGNLHAADLEDGRQVQQLHEEARGDGRHDHVGDHFGHGPQGRAVDAQSAAVAHFEKLPEAHRARGAESEGAEAGQAEQDAERREDARPEPDGKPGLVMNLNVGDERDDGNRVRDVAHADDVSAAKAPGGKEVGDTAHEAPRVEAHAHHERNGKKQDEPVEPGHIQVEKLKG